MNEQQINFIGQILSEEAVYGMDEIAKISGIDCDDLNKYFGVSGIPQDKVLLIVTCAKLLEMTCGTACGGEKEADVSQNDVDAPLSNVALKLLTTIMLDVEISLSDIETTVSEEKFALTCDQTKVDATASCIRGCLQELVSPYVQALSGPTTTPKSV